MKPKNKTLVINGSARPNSNTTKLIHHLLGQDILLVELSEMNVSHYDYASNYTIEDSFQSIADQMIHADLIILTTPVYWYTMSGHMKVFLDRWTDLVTTHKAKGRALKRKKLALIAQSTSPNMPEGFEVPFKLTAEYMDMKYVGSAFWDMRRNINESVELITQIEKWESITTQA